MFSINTGFFRTLVVIRAYVKCALLISDSVRVVLFFFHYFLCAFKWQKQFDMLASFYILLLSPSCFSFTTFCSASSAAAAWYAAIIANYMTDIWLHLCPTQRRRDRQRWSSWNVFFLLFFGRIWNKKNAEREKILFNYVNGSLGMLQLFELRVAQLMGVNMRCNKYLRLPLPSRIAHFHCPPPAQLDKFHITAAISFSSFSLTIILFLSFFFGSNYVGFCYLDLCHASDMNECSIY